MMRNTPFSKKWLSEKANPTMKFNPKPHHTRKRIELLEEQLKRQECSK
jgi:hypothetical protein